MPSRVNDPKRHSTQTLSQPSPRLDLLLVMPCVVSSGWYAVAAYWLPRSEWWRDPAVGFRFARAFVRACSARSMVSRWPIAQPITVRE